MRPGIRIVRHTLAFALALATSAFAQTASKPGEPAYPAHWWTPVPEQGKPAWEILPQAAKPGEVILSKRNELGILSNFAATPFVMRGKKYASVEGLWQMMKYPEGPDDERAKYPGLTWPHTREQVAQMTAFEAKAAGDAAHANMRKMGIDWVTFGGKRIVYWSKVRGEHYAIILEAMRAKLAQNPKVREILLSTGDLKLLPDHNQMADSPDEWRYFDMWMELRTELRKQSAAAVAARRVREASHAPTLIPDRVVLNITADPAHSAAVNWRTATGTGEGFAEIAVAGDGPELVKNARRIPAVQSQDLTSDINKSSYHSAVLDQLEPATLYAYRVGDGQEHWSEWHQFRTAAASAATPLTLLYVGDAQNDILSLWSRLIRTGHAKAPEASVLIHAGDLINRGTSDLDWGEWHRAGGWIHSTLFSMPVPGNHEYSGGAANAPRAITKHWRAQFHLPTSDVAVVPGVEETSYYADIQGVRLIAMNSNEKQKEQAEWLDRLMSDTSKPRPRWTLITFHHPIFSASKGRDNADLRKIWQPVFDKYGVDLVMTGHDHTYARSNLVSGTNMRAGKSGTVYVVSVSGPKMYNLERESWMDRAAEDTQLFQVIRIHGNKLSYESMTARGTLYDAFDLVKPASPSSQQKNRLVNRTPKSPERLRKPATDELPKATN